MVTVLDSKTMRRLLLCLGAGLGAGFVNGLAGTGAGVVFLLAFGLTDGGMTKTVFSLSMACVVPLSAVSLLTYPPPPGELTAILPQILFAAVTGGLCGAWLQRRLRVQVLKWVFGGLVIFAGLRMML